MMRRALFTMLIVVLSVGGQLPAGAETRLPEKLAISNSQLRELYLQGKHTEAIPVARNIVALTKRNLGEKAPEKAVALNNLAKLYVAEKRYTEAEQVSL